MRRIAALLLLAAPAFAQFRNLVATDTGDQLFFSSPFRQTGSDQLGHAKLFAWSAAGFRLVEQRAIEGPGPGFFNFHELIQPDVSGDGSVITFVGYSPCFGGSSCAFHEYYRSSWLRTGGEPVDLGLGRAQLSRNGRYAALYGSTDLSSRVNLETGERIPNGGYVAADRQAITSNGELLVHGFGGPGMLVLWSPARPINVATGFVAEGTAIVSDDASRVVLNVSSGEGYSLWAVRTDRTEARQLAPNREHEYAPAISNDGRWVVFEAGGGVVLVDLVAGTSRELIAPDDGVAETTISGTGNVIFVATGANRLLRVEAASGEVDELTPRIPAVGAAFRQLGTANSVPTVFGAPVPGSLNWIRGSGLAERLLYAPFPLPESLAGAQVSVGDLQAPIVAVAPEQIVYQIPFEAPPGETSVRILGPAAPFEAVPMQVELRRQQLKFVTNGYEAWTPGLEIGQAVVVTQDFTALVTPDNPARERDIVHLYATGGGPVAAPVASGVPTPADPLPAVTPPVECYYYDQGARRPLETFYVGLAPGMIGVYQISLRLPHYPESYDPDAAEASLTVGCGEGDFLDLVSVPMRPEP